MEGKEMNAMNDETMVGLLAGLGAFMVIAVIIGIAMYVLYGISHMKAFKLMGYKNAWAAWIPFYSDYALADCIPESKETVHIFGLAIPETYSSFGGFLLLQYSLFRQ